MTKLHCYKILWLSFVALIHDTFIPSTLETFFTVTNHLYYFFSSLFPISPPMRALLSWILSTIFNSCHNHLFLFFIMLGYSYISMIYLFFFSILQPLLYLFRIFFAKPFFPIFLVFSLYPCSTTVLHNGFINVP